MKKICAITLLILLTTLQSCVQKTHLKTVTFKVDMNTVETMENVGIRGNFTNPSWTETIPLTDENNDGIYEITVSKKTAVSRIQFKFVNQNQYELTDQPNRTLSFKYEPETLVYEAIFNIAN